ncbi:hypothetical protein B0H14DRAFT_3439963 [Mycena olivaceomarginata]|nr:hypothetical protein B0H14DRAFT_3439963 [Mycena olivaceomarginata]
MCDGVGVDACAGHIASDLGPRISQWTIPPLSQAIWYSHPHVVQPTLCPDRFVDGIAQACAGAPASTPVAILPARIQRQDRPCFEDELSAAEFHAPLTDVFRLLPPHRDAGVPSSMTKSPEAAGCTMQGGRRVHAHIPTLGDVGGQHRWIECTRIAATAPRDGLVPDTPLSSLALGSLPFDSGDIAPFHAFLDHRTYVARR